MLFSFFRVDSHRSDDTVVNVLCIINCNWAAWKCKTRFMLFRHSRLNRYTMEKGKRYSRQPAISDKSPISDIRCTFNFNSKIYNTNKIDVNRNLCVQIICMYHDDAMSSVSACSETCLDDKHSNHSDVFYFIQFRRKIVSSDWPIHIHWRHNLITFTVCIMHEEWARCEKWYPSVSKLELLWHQYERILSAAHDSRHDMTSIHFA